MLKPNVPLRRAENIEPNRVAWTLAFDAACGGPENDGDADNPEDDVWVYDWRTPMISEVDPDRDAISDAPKPASDPPQRARWPR
jgi:hypothetical protein